MKRKRIHGLDLKTHMPTTLERMAEFLGLEAQDILIKVKSYGIRIGKDRANPEIDRATCELLIGLFGTFGPKVKHFIAKLDFAKNPSECKSLPADWQERAKAAYKKMFETEEPIVYREFNLRLPAEVAIRARLDSAHAAPGKQDIDPERRLRESLNNSRIAELFDVCAKGAARNKDYCYCFLLLSRRNKALVEAHKAKILLREHEAYIKSAYRNESSWNSLTALKAHVEFVELTALEHAVMRRVQTDDLAAESIRIKVMDYVAHLRLAVAKGDVRAAYALVEIATKSTTILNSMVSPTCPDGVRSVAQARAEWPIVTSPHAGLRDDEKKLFGRLALNNVCKLDEDDSARYAPGSQFSVIASQLYMYLKEMKALAAYSPQSKEYSTIVEEAEKLPIFTKANASVWWIVAKQTFLKTFPEPQKNKSLLHLLTALSHLNSKRTIARCQLIEKLRLAFLALPSS